MAKQLQLRKGTAAEHSTFTGANGEVTVDTTNKTLRVHDGTTVGGTMLATSAGGSVPAAQLPSATTSTQGIVKLNNTLTSTSTTEALTAAQGKALKDTLDNIIYSTPSIDQFWHDVTGSRAKGVVYTNTTGKPVQVSVIIRDSGSTHNLNFFVNSADVISIPDLVGGSSGFQQLTITVPPTHTYRLETNNLIYSWWELR